MAYNEKTNFANERAYLSNLMSNGNYGQQEWAKNQMGLLTATENEIMQQRLQKQQQQQQRPQQPQQVNDLSDYLRDMYRQQMQANLSALEGAYNANVTRMQRQGELIPQKYDAMRNLAAAQNELSRRNFGEYAAARGLNTGTSEHAELFAEWAYPVAYTVGQLRRHNGTLYKCVQAHTSQADWTPDATASLWIVAADPAEEWPAWSQPFGAHDAYAKGDKVSHNGKHWISTADANVWEPGVYGWTEVTE